MSDSRDGVRGIVIELSRSVVPDSVRRSYALKFGLWFVVLTVVIGAGGLATTGVLADDARADTNQDLVGVTSQTANSLENWNDRNHNLNEIVAGNVDGNNTLVQIEENLRTDSLSAMPPYVTSLHYVDVESNRVLASTTDGNEVGERLENVAGTDASTGQAWATEENLAFDGTRGVSGVYTDEDTTKVAYYRDVDGGGAGEDRVLVLVADLEASSIGLGSDTSASGFVQVVDGSGTVAFDELDGRYGQAYYGGSESPVLQAAMASAAGVNEYAGSPVADQLGTDSYLVVHKQVEGTNWVVLRHENPQEVYGFVSNVQQLGVVGTIVLVVIIGVFATALSLRTSRSIDRLKEKAQRIEEEDLDVDFSTKRIDSVGQLYDAFGEMQASLREQIRRAEDARDDAERLNDHLEQKVESYNEVMQAASEGDLTKRMNPKSEHEAMAELGHEFNEMIADFESAVVELQYFASDVATASERVNENVEEVDTASRRVTEAIQKISDGAEKQHARFQDVSSEVDELSSTIEEIASTSSEVADIAHETAETGREGREAAGEAIESIDAIERGANNAVAEIERLDDEMEKVDELVEVISDLAHQINMMALNANIEASRGGSSSAGDDGFQVVAQEVKELDEEAKEAAEDIEARLERIDEQTERTASQVRAVNEHVSENADSVLAAASALDEVAEYAQETNTGVQEISAATEEQAASTEEVVAMTEGATEISNRTASEAETVAAAAEEQTANLADVSGSADRLSQRASDLWDALAAFEVASDGTEGDAAEDDGEGGDERVAELPSTDGGATDVDFGDDDGDAGDDFEWSVDE